MFFLYSATISCNFHTYLVDKEISVWHDLLSEIGVTSGLTVTPRLAVSGILPLGVLLGRIDLLKKLLHEAPLKI